jgi:hypothetical protein
MYCDGSFLDLPVVYGLKSPRILNLEAGLRSRIFLIIYVLLYYCEIHDSWRNLELFRRSRRDVIATCSTRSRLPRNNFCQTWLGTTYYGVLSSSDCCPHDRMYIGMYLPLKIEFYKSKITVNCTVW